MLAGYTRFYIGAYERKEKMRKISSYQILKMRCAKAELFASYRYTQIYNAKKDSGILLKGFSFDDDLLVGGEESISMPPKLSVEELEKIIGNMRFIPSEKE